ncbi:MAG: monovalent cation/H(+) antiporter subunit G [Caldilineaceae bacterium]|nr:monovalent cation/H(+) antiporter subunit G [Caldilineaceae bacterium]
MSILGVSILDGFSLVLAVIGTFFMFVSAVGILRLPDVYARMHAAGKAATLGVSCILLSAGLHFGESSLLRMLVLIVLFFVTAPIATTTMARAAHSTDETRRSVLLHCDELEEAVEDLEPGPKPGPKPESLANAN